MGLNLNFLGGVYRGAQDELARQANEERLKARDEREAKQAERMDQEAAFAEETRGRQRKAWSKQDEIEANEKKYRAEFEAQKPSDAVNIPQAALTPQTEQKTLQADENQSQAEVNRLLSAGTPSQGAKPATPVPLKSDENQSQAETKRLMASGTPQPAGVPDTSASSGTAATGAAKLESPGGIAPPKANFNNALALQQYVLNRKMAAGEVDPTTYTQHLRNIESFKEEGGARALKLFAQGRNDEAIEAWNNSGQMAGAKLISSKQGTTKIDGVEMPTNYVELQLPGGRVISMDTAKAQKQMLSYEQQLASAQQNRQITNQENFHKDSITLQREQMAQNARHQAASLGLQQQTLKLHQQQYADTTPLGKIRLLEQANGKPLSDDEKSNILGLSNMPKAQQMRMQSLLKQHEELSKIVATEQARGTFVPVDKDGKPNSVLVQMSIISQQLNDLSSGNKNPFADIKNPQPSVSTPPVGGVPPASGAVTRPVQQPASKTVQPPVGGINSALEAAIKKNPVTGTLSSSDTDVLGLLDGTSTYTAPEPRLRVNYR